jgi:hypothetical protein
MALTKILVISSVKSIPSDFCSLQFLLTTGSARDRARLDRGQCGLSLVCGPGIFRRLGVDDLVVHRILKPLRDHDIDEYDRPK